MLNLNNILVVSLEQAVAAPFCSNRLAHAGARVIKVERAEGDFARDYDSVVNGESAYFVWLNQGKESLVLNIKDTDDANLLQRIATAESVELSQKHPEPALRGPRRGLLGREDLVDLAFAGSGQTRLARFIQLADRPRTDRGYKLVETLIHVPAFVTTDLHVLARARAQTHEFLEGKRKAEVAFESSSEETLYRDKIAGVSVHVCSATILGNPLRDG